MKTRVLSLIVILPVVVGFVSVAGAAPPPPEGMQREHPGHPPEGMRPEHPERPPEGMPPEPHGPGPLEEMIEVGLHNNPDVRLAEIELQRAEAELMRVRQQVVRDITEIAHERMRCEREIDAIHAELGEVEEKVGRGELPEHELAEMHEALQDAHTGLASSEAALHYLLGVGPGMEPRGPRPETEMHPEGGEPQASPRPELPDHLRQALSAPCNVEFDEVPLAEVLMMISDRTGVNFIAGELGELPLSFHLSEVSFFDALIAVSELVGNEICFVVREYGLLVTHTERARMMPGAVIPPYIPYYGPPVPADRRPE